MNASAMVVSQTCAKAHIGGTKKKQSNAESEKYDVKHDLLLLNIDDQDAQSRIILRYGFAVRRIRKL
jgi:hypothetical protein